MSTRTLEAKRALEDASTRLFLAKRDLASADEIKYLQRTLNLRKSIFDNLSRTEPITASDRPLKRAETPDQIRMRTIGRDLMRARFRQQRGKLETVDLNPRFRDQLDLLSHSNHFTHQPL